jgi:hypothetical protein
MDDAGELGSHTRAAQQPADGVVKPATADSGAELIWRASYQPSGTNATTRQGDASPP